jgi:hypothetical protein
MSMKIDAGVKKSVVEKSVAGRTPKEIAEDLGCSTQSVYRVLWETGTPCGQGKPVAEPETFEDEEPSDGIRVIKSVGSRIKTVAELLREAEVDTARWKVHRPKVRKWDAQQKGPDGEPVVIEMWLVAVELEAVKESEVQWDRVKAGLVEVVKAHAPDYSKLKPHVRPLDGKGKLLEIDIFDAHVGLLSWPVETGAAWDSAVAETQFLKTVDMLLGQASAVCRSIDRVVLVTGGDFLHMDTEQGQTTKGTVLDVDTRATRVFKRGQAILTAAADKCLTVASSVYLPMVPGNHDRFALQALGEVLSAWYRGMAGKVTVDAGPRLRKYLEWGKCLLGWTHGSEEKKERLPGIMATEQKEAWGRTRHRAWRIGHFHHKARLLMPMGDTLDGVWVRQSAALCPRDAWHVRKGFVGAPRGGSASLWDRERGEIMEFTVTLD